MACRLLRLFSAENDGDVILDLQIMNFFSGSMRPDAPPPSLAPLSGTLAPVSGNSLRPPCFLYIVFLYPLDILANLII